MRNPSYTYENVQIGNFLIALGYSLRDRDTPLNASINLFQQTPEDYRIGDVFGGLNCKYFIIEFKRNNAHLSEELKKNPRANLAKEIVTKDDQFNISIASHLMIYPSWGKNEELKYEVQPYLRAIGVTASKNDENLNPFKDITSPSEFIEEIYRPVPILGCSIEDMELYIKLLQSCISNSENSFNSGGVNNVTGLAMCTDPETGKIQSFKFDNLADLQRKMQKTKEISPKPSMKEEEKLNENKQKGRKRGGMSR